MRAAHSRPMKSGIQTLTIASPVSPKRKQFLGQSFQSSKAVVVSVDSFLQGGGLLLRTASPSDAKDAIDLRCAEMESPGPELGATVAHNRKRACGRDSSRSCPVMRTLVCDRSNFLNVSEVDVIAELEAVV
jgi:hypothetical protein